MTEGEIEEVAEQQQQQQEEVKYPEGYNAELWNLQENAPRVDEVGKKLTEYATQVESLTKQRNDLRVKISKGFNAPTQVDEYNRYTPDSKYTTYYKSEDGQEAVKGFNEFALSQGLSCEQHKAVLNYFFETLEEAGILDTTDPQTAELQRRDAAQAELKKIGDNAVQRIAETRQFVNECSFFNKEQQATLQKLIDSGAVGFTACEIMKDMFNNKVANMKMPVRASTVDAVASNAELEAMMAKAYESGNTAALKELIDIQNAQREG